MTFTPLHRALGVSAGPITFEMLEQAIEIGVPENEELDWKRGLPPAEKFKDSDIVKDIAAMANSGGGMIVFGIAEKDKAATGWGSAPCVINEAYERTIRQAAWSKISPPVLNLTTGNVDGPDGKTAAWLMIPPSDEYPHLDFDAGRFRAPVRNGPDTYFMSERQIEAAYRARFDSRLRSEQALGDLYSRTAQGHSTDTFAWIFAVAKPTVSTRSDRLTLKQVLKVCFGAEKKLHELTDEEDAYFFAGVDRHNPRPGYRSWRFLNRMDGEHAIHETWVTVHDDGSVGLAAVVGGGYQGATRERRHTWAGHQIRPNRLEEVVAAFACLVRETARETNQDAYEIHINLAWTGEESPQLLELQWPFRFFTEGHEFESFVPVARSINALSDDEDFGATARELALDCINQGGSSDLTWFKPVQAQRGATGSGFSR